MADAEAAGCPVHAGEQMLLPFPAYHLDESRETTWSNGQVRGPRNIPVFL